MDANELKKLMSQMLGYMARHGLQRMKVKTGDLELELEKPRGSYVEAPPPSMPLHPVTSSSSPPSIPLASEGHLVTSPIVGTFYTSSSPSAPAFVKVGDRVEENTVVCIIEAMKVMNEVRSGKAGTVAQIYVESGHPVEYGTKILRIV